MYANRLLPLTAFLFLLFASITVRAEKVVNVLGYPFPPFVNEDLKSGLSVDLLNLLNKSQSDYKFDLKFTSPKRRYQDMQSSKFDMILFEMQKWGWDTQPVPLMATRDIMEGGEVYITKNMTERDFSFFDNLAKKRIAGYFGYHYAFAKFNADRDWLQNHFNIVLYHSHERIIEMVRLNKADIGVVTLSYLRRFLSKYPEIKGDILISNTFDQKYKLPALLKKDAPLTPADFGILLDRLKENGELQALFDSHGLLKQLTW